MRNDRTGEKCGQSFGERVAGWIRGRDFAFWDYPILAVAVALVFGLWFGITRGCINLTHTNYPTGMNRWAIFSGVNAVLIPWGLFHLFRAKSHKEEWEAYREYFHLNFLGIGILTGDPYVLLVSDLIGFGLMIYAVGVFAFPIVFKFIPWIAAFGVFAGRRSIDYVQYPFGVLLCLAAVVMYVINRGRCWKARQETRLESEPASGTDEA